MSAEDFVPENRVEEAMRAAALDQAAFPAFLRALADGEVLVPVLAPPAPDGSVSLLMLEHEGVDHVLLFTSETQLGLAGYAESPRVSLTGRAFARSCPPDTTIAVNPRGGLGLALAPGTVRRLAADPDGVGELTIPAGARLQIGEPADEPVALLQALSAAARAEPSIVALHRALVIVSGSDEPPLIAIGVEFAPDARDADVTVRRLAAVAGTDLAMFELDRRQPSGIGKWMVERDAPFYRR